MATRVDGLENELCASGARLPGDAHGRARGYALHTAPGLPVGMIATGTGPMMACGGTFDVTFTGTGGHGAHLTPI